MTHEEIKKTIKGLILDSEELDIADISDDATIESLDIDSLDTELLVSDIEAKFEIQISDEHLEMLSKGTFNDLVTFIAEKLK